MFAWLRAITQFAMLRWLTKLTILIVLAHISWQNWLQYGPTGVALPIERQQLANLAVNGIANDIARNRGSVRRVVLPAVVGDSTFHVTARLSDVLEKRGIVAIAPQSLRQRLEQWLRWSEPRDILPLEAAQLAAEAGADATLLVRLDIFEMNDVTGQIRGSWSLVDHRGQLLHQAAFDQTNALRNLPPLAANSSVFGIIAPALPSFDISTWIIVLVIAAMLPLVTIGVMRAGVNHGSSAARVALLLLYSCCVTAITIAMVDLNIRTRGGIAVALSVFFAAFIYNLWIMSSLVEERDET
jgi:hypothetical protein